MALPQSLIKIRNALCLQFPELCTDIVSAFQGDDALDNILTQLCGALKEKALSSEQFQLFGRSVSSIRFGLEQSKVENQSLGIRLSNVEAWQKRTQLYIVAGDFIRGMATKLPSMFQSLYDFCANNEWLEAYTIDLNKPLSAHHADLFKSLELQSLKSNIPVTALVIRRLFARLLSLGAFHTKRTEQQIYQAITYSVMGPYMQAENTKEQQQISQRIIHNSKRKRFNECLYQSLPIEQRG